MHPLLLAALAHHAATSGHTDGLDVLIVRAFAVLIAVAATLLLAPRNVWRNRRAPRIASKDDGVSAYEAAAVYEPPQPPR